MEGAALEEDEDGGEGLDPHVADQAAVQHGVGGGDAEADARSFTVKAEAGSDVFGIVSNPFLDREFKTVRFSSTYRLIDDKTFEYEQDTEIQMKDKPDLFHHVDRNRLTRIAGPH